MIIIVIIIIIITSLKKSVGDRIFDELYRLCRKRCRLVTSNAYSFHNGDDDDDDGGDDDDDDDANDQQCLDSVI